jgi:hypothetical protein
MPLPVFQQPISDMNIQGFIPIINVTPVTNLKALLGLADENDNTKDLSIIPLLHCQTTI